MTLVPDPVVTPIAEGLLSCLVAEMAKVPNPPTSPRYVCLRPGDRVDLLVSQSVDECCQGLTWVRFSQMYPSQQRFPQQDQSSSPCGVIRWAVSFELGSVRCAPTADLEEVPTCDQWIENTVGGYDDLAALRRAVCCYQEANTDRLVYQGLCQPLSVEGGCSGMIMSVVVSAPACDCRS